MKDNHLKQKMLSGETAYGIFINSGSSIACEIAGLSGFDFVLIDSEHGPTAVMDNRELIIAAECRNITPIIRVPNAHSDTILRTMDIGAHGVMVPQVNDIESAQSIARAARYSPMGERGVALARAADYGFMMPISKYFECANKRNLVIAQCENMKAVSEIEEICKIEGIDIIFVGPYDLSSSMGKIGQVSYESIKEVVDKVLDVAKKHNKIAGIFTKDAEEAKMYAQMGFRFIVVSTDISCMVTGFRQLVKELEV